MKLVRLLGLTALLMALHSLLVADTSNEATPLITRISGPTSVAAEISGHQIFVDVMINGHGPFHVMVDTGCSVTLVSPELAEAVNATVQDPEEDSILAQNGLGDLTNVQRVVLGTIDLGSVCFEGVTAAVSGSFETLSSIAGRRVDGALGYPLFADLFLGLDFPNHRVLLSHQWPTDIPPILTSLPVVEHINVPFVQVDIQGKPVEVMVDTGANQALQLPTGLAASLQWKVEPRVGSLVAVIGEVGREGIGRLVGNLSLGSVVQVEPTAIVSSGPPSIGVRSLERYCVIFHQAEHKLWLCGPASEPILPVAERSDGLSLYSDAGGWRVAGVIPGSPAEAAKIAAGTLVTQVEGSPAMSWTRDQMEQWINTHADIALTIIEQSGERALTLRAWDLVP